MVSQKPKYCKNFERNGHWRKLSMIMVWERYCNASPKPEFFFIFFVYIFIHISANMSPFGLKFSQMILHTERSRMMCNWSFLFEVLHKPTLLPSTFKSWSNYFFFFFLVSFCSVTVKVIRTLMWVQVYYNFFLLRFGLFPSDNTIEEILPRFPSLCNILHYKRVCQSQNLKERCY